MKIKTIGYITGSLQLIVTAQWQIIAIQRGYWDYTNLPNALAGISLGVFIILLSTKLKKIPSYKKRVFLTRNFIQELC